MRTVSPSRSTATPRRMMQSSVAPQSPLVAKPLILEEPEASAASIAARWEIDLSPGMFKTPLICPGPKTLTVLDIPTFAMLHNLTHRNHLAGEVRTLPKILRIQERKASREPMTETIELTIKSKFELVEEVGSITRTVTDKVGFDEDTAGWIDLAVREAVINAIKHGNKNVELKDVDVKFVIENESITVYVRDWGEGFDPEKLPNPLDPDNLLNPAGRGIFFMRTFMDEVDYSTHPEGGSICRMAKHKL